MSVPTDGSLDLPPPARGLRVIGWDPGLAHLGYAVLEVSPARVRVLAHGDVGQANDCRVEERLDRLAVTIDGLFNTWLPDVCGYENQAGVEVAKQLAGEGSTFSSRRVHEVTGLIRMAANCALSEALPIYTPTPMTIKVAVLGKGNRSADKSQIKHAVKRLFGVRCGEHAADAIACAVATLRQHRVATRRVPVQLATG